MKMSPVAPHPAFADLESPSTPSFRLMTLFPNVCTGEWVSHICVSLCESLARYVPTAMYAHSLCGDFRSTVVAPSVSPWATSLAYRLDRLRPFLNDRTLRRYLRDLRQHDICWIWPGTTLDAVRVMHERGQIVIAEAINCHQAVTRTILDKEFARLGWPATHDITDERIGLENELYALVDYVFAPSPLVRESLLANSVPRRKVIETSYGWSPLRFPATGKTRHGFTFTVLFAGTVCVRKGAHLLAEAWRRAGLRGRLRFAGNVSADFEGSRSQSIEGHAIEHLGYQKQLAHWYGDADVFAFPTLEEGSPLVVYEAAACGLPIVTTPMGAGSVIRDGFEGIVLDPHDQEGWVAALQRLERDPEYRGYLGRNARARANEFTWETVAKRRMTQIAKRCAGEMLA